jgi:4-hydroxybenzoate polyprenyltransferase
MDQGVEPAVPSGPARIPDYLFILRPMILIPVWTFYLLGAWHGRNITGAPIQRLPFLMGLVSFTAILGAVYIINQIADRETDRINSKLFFVSHGIISIRSAWIEASVLVVLAFALSLILMPAAFTVLLIVSLGLGIAYSVEPVRLKRRPVLDVLSNAVGNGILNTIAGWIAVGAPLEKLETLAPYPLAVASVHLATTLADIEGDRAGGMRTSGVALGARRGTVLSAGLMAAAAVAATAVGNRPAFYASLLSLPVFLIPAGSSKREHTASSVLLPAKAATLIFSVTAGFLYPLYIPFLAVLVLGTRLYYRNRFGVVYPGLKG